MSLTQTGHHASCADPFRASPRIHLKGFIRLTISTLTSRTHRTIIAVGPRICSQLPVMTERRRTSTRFRGEPPLKKRATTPPPPPPPAPAAVEPVVHSGLPTRLQDGQRLPTLSRQQDPDLPSSEYRSIAERWPLPHLKLFTKLTIDAAAS